METQKYRINRDLTGTTWTIPCTGTTNVWPMNTSTNCSGTTVTNSTCKDIFNYINGDTNDFPDDLKECSPTTPCIILWNCGTPSMYNIPLTTNLKCSNLEGYNYVKFTGLKVTCTLDGILNSYMENFEEIKKIMTVYKQRTGITLNPTPQVTDCDCINPLNDISHKIQIYLSQDFNDIGHYDLWDGNMSQRDLFANFTISATTTAPLGYDIILTNTMNYSYYDELAPFTYTIDWGDGLSDTLNSNTPSITHTYTIVATQRTVKLIQDSPWGPMTSAKLLTLPLNSYPQMFGQAYLAGDVNNPIEPFHTGTGIGPNQINVSGQAGGMAASSSAYHARYPDFPLDSATNINQFSGMSFTGLDCYVVTGVTESVLGNFQSYTTQNSLNLPPGYLEGVWVPIGGDVIHPLNNTFQTGMYGVITTATTTYTAYTVSSSFGATTNNADGDTPITFYDFSNGITIFEADSCGLDKRAFGALACIECPEDDCEWCENKDEYYDRVDEVNVQLPTIVNQGLWIPHPNIPTYIHYKPGDLVYDETWSSCCCFIAVKDITPSDAWYGKPPSISNEGKFLDSGGTEVHVWEACSYDCISCGLGTQTPCNDSTAPGWTGEVYGQPLVSFNLGDYVEDQHGNCYEAVQQPATNPPTASTVHWDYIGCVSWICPTDPAGTDCIMISGPQQGGTYGEMVYQDCINNLNSANGCFAPQYACENQYGCEGCTQIGATSLLYNTPSSFSSTSACVEYCNPIAWSCATPTGSECCYELSCDNTYSQYMSTVGTLYPGPQTNVDLTNFANTYDIYVSPLFDSSDCQSGCCVNTSWAWSCGDAACMVTGGPPNGTNTFSTPAECETYILTQSFQYSAQGASILTDVICGWTCMPQDIDCVYQPCEPCYWASCGNNSEYFCNVNCSGGTMCGCWVCNCYSVTPSCSYQLPCTATTLSQSYLPAGYYVSAGDIFDSGGNYVAPLPMGPNPGMGSYSSGTECEEFCICDTGWDCWLSDEAPPPPNPTTIDSGTVGFNSVLTQASYNAALATYQSTGLSPIGMCSNPGSLLALQNLGYEYSQPPPFTGYTSFIECCENTGCCFARCNEVDDPYSSYTLHPDDEPYYITESISWGYGVANGFPSGTITPCHWDDSLNTANGTCNDPSAANFVYNVYWDWCTLDICNQYGVVSGATALDPLTCMDEFIGECDCACGTMTNPDFSASTGGWNGSWIGYESGDAVSWSDADTDYCCFMCVCPNLGTDWTDPLNITAAFNDPWMQDCDIHEPDLDPSTQGLGNVANCWESCNQTPVIGADPTDPDTCEPCGSTVSYYECTPDLGCVSTLNCASPALCYTTSNCDDMCDSSCFCNGYNNANCVGQCITAEVVALNPVLFNMINTCGPFSYINGYTLDNCNADLLSGALDCCGAEQWYCDGSAGCSYVNLAQISANITSTSGLGCVRVYPADSQYQTGTLDSYHFTNQLDCQEECRWVCDSAGITTCTFVLGAPISSSYPTAFSCYLATTDCDCTSAATEWWCYDDQDPLSTMGGCISNTTWLNYSQSMFVYGQGGGTMNSGTPAFASLGECETHCRFCCDESDGGNGGYCEHVWDGVGCCSNNQFSTSCDWPTELDCFLNQTQYPCIIGYGIEYFCDTVVGCTQFPTNIAPGSGPTGTMDGWTLISDCNDHCAFDCNDECECEVTLSPVYGGGNPLNGIGAPWAAITGCIVSTANGDKCCDCDCLANNATVYWTYYDPNTTTWPTQASTANNLQNPISAWTGAYLPTANNGDAVTHNGCCFIVINSHTNAAGWALSPTQAYQNYLDGMASSNPADFPTYLVNFGNPTLYFPCDPNCVSVTGSTADWYCDANIITNTPNCVQDTGIWTNPYSDNVFGLGQTSYTNNSNNGFHNQIACEEKCRFCCVEEERHICKKCCKTKNHGPQSLVPHSLARVTNTSPNDSVAVAIPSNSSVIYYWDTTYPCKCNAFDVIVADHYCKGGPKLPNDDKYIRQMSDTYLQTYDNETGNPGRQLRLLQQEMKELAEYCRNGKSRNLGDGDSCLDKLHAMEHELEKVQDILNTTSGPQYGCTDQLATNYCLGCTIDDGSCLYGGTSSIWGCELDWGNTDCYTLMYSCVTFCDEPDPCDCVGVTVAWSTSPHEGVYIPTFHSSQVNIPTYYLGPWYANMNINPSIWNDVSYTIDPKDGCCYSYSHHNGSGPNKPYGPYTPSECYNNHLLGLYCDGSMYQSGVYNSFDNNQGEYPIWWPCDEACPPGGACPCDATTQLWDVSVQYAPGDKVLYPCTQPVINVGGTSYCCFQASGAFPGCCVPGFEPIVSDGACEYWELICGCDDKCPWAPDCPPIGSSWKCTIYGCTNVPGTHYFSLQADCIDVCAEFLCSEDTQFAGTAKCQPSESSTAVSYVDANTNATVLINSSLTFVNAFLNGEITFAAGNTIINTTGLLPIHYTYFNTQPPQHPNMYQGCPDGNGGFRSSVDSDHVIVSYGGIYGGIANNWDDLINVLSVTPFFIDISSCDTFGCAQNIVLNQSDPNNNCPFPFTYFEPSRRPCRCSTSTLDCQCLLVAGTGHTGASGPGWHIDDYIPCLNDCCAGLCSDCKSNLETTNYILATDTLLHQGLQSYYGTAFYGYSIFDCITDPVDDCCMCCVDNQQGNTVQDIWGPIQADCHIYLTAPTPYTVSMQPQDGTTTGTGMWVHCGVNENNQTANCPTGVVIT